MPLRSCPECQRPAPRYLEGSSANASVDYYRCEACGHVFHIPKGQPDASPTSVTLAPTS